MKSFILTKFRNTYGISEQTPLIIENGSIVALARYGTTFELYKIQPDVSNVTNISALNYDYIQMLFPSVYQEIQQKEQIALEAFCERNNVDKAMLHVDHGTIMMESKFWYKGEFKTGIFPVQYIDYETPESQIGEIDETLEMFCIKDMEQEIVE